MKTKTHLMLIIAICVISSVTGRTQTNTKSDSAVTAVKVIDGWLETNVLPKENFYWYGESNLDHPPDTLKFTSIEAIEVWATGIAKIFLTNNIRKNFTLPGEWSYITFKIQPDTYPQTVIDETGKSVQNFDLEINWEINMGEYQISRLHMVLNPYSYQYDYQRADYSLYRKNFFTNYNEGVNISPGDHGSVDHPINGIIGNLKVFSLLMQ